MVEIAVSKHIPITYNDIKIFPNPDALEALSSYDKPILGKNGISYLFENLGMCLNGFTKKRVPEGKLLIAFPKEYLDDYRRFIDM